MNKRISYNRFFPTLFIVVHLLIATPASSQELEVVALGLQQAPALPAGTVFNSSSFRWPAINSAGQVSFLARVSGGKDVLYYGTPGNLALIAMEGNPAPGSGGRVFCSLILSNPGAVPVPADNGSIAFAGQVKPAQDLACVTTGLWVFHNNLLSLVALENEQAADVDAGLVYQSIAHVFRYSDSGIIFSATLKNSQTQQSVGTGLWVGEPGNLQLLAFQGDPAPDLPGKNYFNFYEFLRNNSNQSSFFATFNGANSDQGIYLGDTANLDLVYKSGAEASEFAVGYVFDDNQIGTKESGLSDNGGVCFATRVINSANLSETAQTLWRVEGASREIIADEINSDPGLAPDYEFTDFQECFINAAGHTLFRANISSPTQGASPRGVWLSSKSSEPPAITPITSTGDTLSEENTDYTVRSVSNAEPYLNRYGEVAFAVPVDDPDSALRTSVWISSGVAEKLAAITGQSVAVAAADVRILSAIRFGFQQQQVPNGNHGSGNEDGKASAFSDSGQIVFEGDLGPVGAVLVTPARSNIILIDPFETDP